LIEFLTFIALFRYFDPGFLPKFTDTAGPQPAAEARTYKGCSLLSIRLWRPARRPRSGRSVSS